MATRMLGVFCVAQVAPDFEPAISDNTITVYVDEDTQPGKLLFPERH